MAIPRKKNIAGYYDELGRFRPIRTPSFVGSPTRRATPKDRKKYSKAKAGDLGPVAQEKATGEDMFARIGRKDREAKQKIMSRIEREALGEADEMDRGRSLVAFVRDAGGIRPGYKFGGKANRGKRISYDAGELAPLTYKESGKRGLVSDNGKKSLDDMFKAAKASGYRVGDTWDLINLMQDEINGGKVTYATSGYQDYRDNPAGQLPKGAKFRRRRNRGDLYVIEGRYGEELGYGFTKEEAIDKARTNLSRVLKNRRTRRRAAASPRASGGQNRLFNPARFSWSKNAHNWALLHDGDLLATLTHNSGRSYTVKISRGDDKTFQAQSLAKAKTTALAFARKGFAGYRDYKNSQPSVAYVNRIISKAAIAKHGKVTRIEPVAFTSDKYRIVFADGYSQDSRIPKENGVLVGDGEYKSDLYVTQLGPRSFGVFLKTYLLKKFATKVAAMKHIASIRKRRKVNPTGTIVGVKNGIALVRYLDEKSKTAYSIVADGFEISRPKSLAVGRKELERIATELKTKKNPVNIFGVVAGLSGVQSLLQIQEMMNKKKRSRRKPAAKRNPSGKTTAKVRNPHGDMPSGARFNEKLFDQDLAQIEDGNFRLIRSAIAHGKLAGYRKPEIDRLVQRARLAFQLKEMYRRKENPADIATLLAPVKRNGAFKRMLQRRKAASALKRELKLEAALEKTRAKKRKAIAAATNPIKVKLWKFYPGQRVVSAGYRGDHSLHDYGSIVKRTAKTVTFKDGLDEKVYTRKIRTFGDSETFSRTPHSPNFYAKDNQPNKNPRSAVGKKAVARSAKANPAASAKKPPRSRTFESFNGRPVTNATRRPVSVHAPAKLAQLGDLIEIKIVGGQLLKPNPSRYKLCASNGRLWIAGGKFAKPNPAAAANEINPIGEIDHVIYRTHKPHHGDAPGTHYIHKLGEETGHRPTLCVDREGFPVIRGGRYKIEARGIVN